MSDNKKDYYKSVRDSFLLQGELDFALVVFGDEIAKRNDYKEQKGIDALHFYLIEKYHWTLSYVRSLKLDDISFLLREEMQSWTLPEEAVFPRQN